MKNVFSIICVLIVFISLLLCLQGLRPLQLEELVSVLSELRYNFQDTTEAYTDMVEVMEECKELMKSPIEALKDLRDGKLSFWDILLLPLKQTGGFLGYIFTAFFGIVMVVFNFLIDFVESIALIVSVLSQLSGNLFKPPLL